METGNGSTYHQSSGIIPHQSSGSTSTSHPLAALSLVGSPHHSTPYGKHPKKKGGHGEGSEGEEGGEGGEDGGGIEAAVEDVNAEVNEAFAEANLALAAAQNALPDDAADAAGCFTVLGEFISGILGGG